jgi:hypothetical protein
VRAHVYMHTYVLYDYVICVECVREYVWRVWGGTGAGLGFLAWAGTPLSHTRIIARAPWLVLVRWQIATKVDIKSSAAGVAGGTSLPPTFPLAPRPLTPTPYTRNPNPETLTPKPTRPPTLDSAGVRTAMGLAQASVTQQAWSGSQGGQR